MCIFELYFSCKMSPFFSFDKPNLIFAKSSDPVLHEENVKDVTLCRHFVFFFQKKKKKKKTTFNVSPKEKLGT